MILEWFFFFFSHLAYTFVASSYHLLRMFTFFSLSLYFTILFFHYFSFPLWCLNVNFYRLCQFFIIHCWTFSFLLLLRFLNLNWLCMYVCVRMFYAFFALGTYIGSFNHHPTKSLWCRHATILKLQDKIAMLYVI